MKITQKFIPAFLILIIFSAGAFSQQTAEDFYRQGMELSAKHKHKEAIAALTEAIRLNSALTEAYLERSRLRQNNQRDMKGALSDIETVLQLDPQLGAAYYERFQIRKSMNGGMFSGKKNLNFQRDILPHRKLELEDLNSAIDYGYKNKQSYESRGFMYWRIFHQYQKAVEDYTSAISFDAEDYDLYNTRGLIKKDNGDLAGAIADMREIVNIYDRAANDKEYPAEKLKKLKGAAIMMLNNMSSLYAESEDSASQLWAIKKSIEIEPNSRGFGALGRYNTVFGELSDAVANYTKAIEFSDGRLPFDFLERGVAYHLQRKLAEAQADFDKAVQIAPNIKNTIKYRIEVTRRQREQKRIRVELP